MKKIAVIPNPLKDKNLKITKLVLNKIQSLGFVPFLEEKFSSLGLLGVEFYCEFPKECDLVIVIGGDGSVIDASSIAVTLGVPLLGVNLGRVGYMVEVDPDKLVLFEFLKSGEYDVEEKMLLSVRKFDIHKNEIVSDRYAVNDVVISHNDYFGIADFMLENERNDHVRYRADGIIVSTPQGSTAYSLSAGGPVISHKLDSITVTPVCPHSFFNRSIVYSPEEKIKISNVSDSIMNISIDGRLFERLNKDECCEISMSEKRLKMVTFGENNVFSTLSKKIKSLQDYV